MISSEKCSEIGNEVYGNTFWNEAMLRRLEELCNRAYAEGQKEGQKDMREKAAILCDENTYEIGRDIKYEIRKLEIE